MLPMTATNFTKKKSVLPLRSRFSLKCLKTCWCCENCQQKHWLTCQLYWPIFTKGHLKKITAFLVKITTYSKKKVLDSVGASFEKKVIMWQLMWHLPSKLSDMEWNSVDLALWVRKVALHCTCTMMSSETSTMMPRCWRRDVEKTLGHFWWHPHKLLDIHLDIRLVPETNLETSLLISNSHLSHR